MAKLSAKVQAEALALQKDLVAFLIEQTKDGVDLRAVFAAMLFQTCVVAKMGDMTEENFMHDVQQGFRNIEEVRHD